MRVTPPTPRRQAGAHGFTLIELLVVIGIIAILIGLLLPTLAAARRTGQQVACAANIKQIGTALELFANDHKGSYPIAGNIIDWDAIDPTTDKPSWMQQIDYYVAAQEPVFDGCPNYPVDTPYHYFLGTRAAFIAADPPGFAAVSRRRIRYTTAFILGGDNTWNGFEAGQVGPAEIDADKDDYTQPCIAFEADDQHWAPQHDDGLNILFADNHVSYARSFDPDRMTYRYDMMSAW